MMSKNRINQVKKGVAGRIAKVRGGLSQRAFARKLGVFQQNINRYEAGTSPHITFLIIVATSEKISLDWLVLGKGAMRSRAA